MREALSDFKLQTGYLKYNNQLGRKETWEEAVRYRVMDMHSTKYHDFMDNPRFFEMFQFAEQAYVDKLVLGSQRALQFGGDPILKKNSKMYNCLTSYCDRVEFFQEAMWWLLSGCGVGFSVLNQYVDKLPTFKPRIAGVKTFVVEDSIEGWSDAIGVLLSSYFQAGSQRFNDYFGCDIKFDFSLIRPKGAPISSGFKAPGPEPLAASISKIEELINRSLQGYEEIKVRPILAYDIVMHSSNAVLAGGVRRSATICMFGKDDLEMRNAKTGNWYIENPQRARSNNSVALLKGETTWEEFDEIMQSVKQYGEPGFVWLDDLKIVYNPCVEIGMVPELKLRLHGEYDTLYSGPGNGPKEEDITYTYHSGWQGCNL